MDFSEALMWTLGSVFMYVFTVIILVRLLPEVLNIPFQITFFLSNYVDNRLLKGLSYAKRRAGESLLIAIAMAIFIIVTKFFDWWYNNQFNLERFRARPDRRFYLPSQSHHLRNPLVRNVRNSVVLSQDNQNFQNSVNMMQVEQQAI